jgi:hypothetical protein
MGTAKVFSAFFVPFKAGSEILPVRSGADKLRVVVVASGEKTQNPQLSIQSCQDSHSSESGTMSEEMHVSGFG